MNSVKSKVFNYLTKAQKSDFCHYLYAYVKKNHEKQTSQMIDSFVEDEKHYLSIDSTRFPWLGEYINSEEFLKDLELYVNECKKKCEYAEKQRPYYEKQKQYAREQRKKAQELKMSKLPPTKAQLGFYKKLCKKYEIKDIVDVETASRLDLKHSIELILNTNKKNI